MSGPIVAASGIPIIAEDLVSNRYVPVLVNVSDWLWPVFSTGAGAFLTPTRDAANLLIAAGGARSSPAGDWASVAAVSLGALAVALAAFWLVARTRSV